MFDTDNNDDNPETVTDNTSNVSLKKKHLSSKLNLINFMQTKHYLFLFCFK